eukprot:356443-Chlamydomonas_euryale.AAC.10
MSYSTQVWTSGSFFTCPRLFLNLHNLTQRSASACGSMRGQPIIVLSALFIIGYPRTVRRPAKEKRSADRLRIIALTAQPHSATLSTPARVPGRRDVGRRRLRPSARPMRFFP